MLGQWIQGQRSEGSGFVSGLFCFSFYVLFLSFVVRGMGRRHGAESGEKSLSVSQGYKNMIIKQDFTLKTDVPAAACCHRYVALLAASLLAKTEQKPI